MDHISLGQAGESIALHYLKEQRLQIIATNWRYSRAEIDIIARSEEELIFIEVKTRSSFRNGYPEDDVDEEKKRMLFDAATAYMEEVDHEGEVRFDVISIVIHPSDAYTIRHIPDAFFPGLF